MHIELRLAYGLTNRSSFAPIAVERGGLPSGQESRGERMFRGCAMPVTPGDAPAAGESADAAATMERGTGGRLAPVDLSLAGGEA